jgi:uncharacterized protein YgbK (DUF1537 family)
LRGARSVVRFDLQAAISEQVAVEAFTTDTRDLDEIEIEARIRRVASEVAPARPRVIFKKIDSLLRGNPGREILSARDAFGCDVAVITPAYPEMGRAVRDGHLHVDRDAAWRPIEVAALLRGQGLEECAHCQPEGIATALSGGARYISIDATSDADLELLVREALRSGRRVLWAGSGGLASALAKTLFSEETRDVKRMPQELPIIFCVGSDHPVTVAQLKVLREQRGEHMILRISWAESAPERLKSSLCGMAGKAGALLLSGGDSASVVCRALEVAQIELQGEVVTGVPWGTLKGGLLDGMIAATKSGAFGHEDTLVQVADFFTCPKN